MTRDGSAPADQPTRWGRVKFGRKRLGALALAIPVGAVVGASTGALTLLSGASEPTGVWGALAVGVIVAWTALTWSWVLIVDRSTIAGPRSRSVGVLSAYPYTAIASLIGCASLAGWLSIGDGALAVALAALLCVGWLTFRSFSPWWSTHDRFSAPE